MSEQAITIITQDKVKLAATLYLTSASPHAIIIINSATGVKKSYYDDYATFLSQHGFMVLCYDYRGIGGSKQQDVDLQKTMQMQDWGVLDFSACILWCQQQYPSLSIACIGHSVGAQIIGLANNNTALSASLSIAGQSGYWRHWDKNQWPKLWLAWFGIIPLIPQCLGYLPGAILGSEDLPKGIAQQWAKWCRHPDYIFDKQGKKWRPYFEQIQSPMHFYHIIDDHDFAPLKSVQALSQFYSNAQVTISQINPKDHGMNMMGHFGFFKRKTPKVFWQNNVKQLITMLNKDSHIAKSI